MTSTQNERKPLTLLSAMTVTGLALLFFPSANVSYWRACIGALIFCVGVGASINF